MRFRLRMRFLARLAVTSTFLCVLTLSSHASDIPSPVGGVYDVQSYGAVGDGKTLETPAIQKAIDAAARDGGGTVRFPPGDYLSGMIRLKSHITLYLENGATLWASPDKADYEMVDAGRLADGNPYLLVADKSEYVSITGAGAIHGQGTADWNRRRDAPRDWSPEFFKWRIGVMLFKDCKRVAINGITILYSQTWTIHLMRCEQVFLEGIAIHNNYYRSTTDGIDVHSCRDVHISNCNITAGDDCICLKTFEGYPCENVVLNNCTLESVATAIKLGTGSHGDFRDIHVSNCTIRNSTVGIGLFIKDGGTAERITFSDISIGTIEDVSQVRKSLKNSTYPIFVDIEKRTEGSPIGAIRDLTFRGIHIHSDNGSLIQGMRESLVENLVLRDITTRIEKPFDYGERRKHGGGSSNPKDDRRTIYARKLSYFTLANINGLVVDNLRVLVAADVFAKYPRSALCINETVDGVVCNLHRTPPGIPGGELVVNMHNCQRMFVTNCFAPPGTPVFLGLSGKNTNGISLAGNDLSEVVQPILRSPKIPEEPTVLTFGAVADGKADDTAAIQKAIDSGIGDIRLLKGIYRITKPIVIDLNKIGYTSIYGSGVARIVMAGPGPALRFVGTHFGTADPKGFSPDVWDRQRMPLVDGISISGDHEQAVGIEAFGTMQITITRVHIHKVLHGIHLVKNNRNVIISDCHIYENRGVGIYYDHVNLHQSNITGCHISYNARGGIVSRAGNVRNIHISGCDIESNMSPDTEPTANVLIDCRESKYGTAEVAITGCTIQHNHASPDSANIRMIGRSNRGDDSQPTREGLVTITGNVLSDVQCNVHLQQCRGVVMTGNTAWRAYGHNLLVEDCSNIIIGANNFGRRFPGDNAGDLEAPSNNLIFRHCKDCTLTGLHITDVWRSPAGLTIEGCERMNIANCTILDCDQAGLLLNDATNSLVTGCLIRNDRPGNASWVPVRVTGGHSNVIENNQ